MKPGTAIEHVVMIIHIVIIITKSPYINPIFLVHFLNFLFINNDYNNYTLSITFIHKCTNTYTHRMGKNPKK